MAFDAQKVLCNWGIHFHSKKAIFRAKGVKIKFIIPICPHCEHPKRKSIKIFFPNGKVGIDKIVYKKLIYTLRESKMILNGFTGNIRSLSNSFQRLLKQLEIPKRSE